MRTDETAETSTRDILMPLEQATIPFYGRTLVAVRLPDGRICAILRWLCEGMQLEIHCPGAPHPAQDGAPRGPGDGAG